MNLPRITIGWLMFAIALPCIPFVLVQTIIDNRSLISSGILYCDLGLWPGLVAFLTASVSIASRRGKASPYFWGFAIVGWASLFAYAACSYWCPRTAEIPVMFYLTKIHYPWISSAIGSDNPAITALHLLTIGLFVSIPQLMMAIAGGLMARWIWGARWTST
jgi:hypothetical protein